MPKNDGSLWTSGKNDYGYLGNGTNVNSNIPVQVHAKPDKYFFIGIKPVAKLASSYLLHYGKYIVLDASYSIDPNGSIIKYEWKIINTNGQDDIILLEGIRPNVELREGIYIVKLRVTDNEDAIDETQMILAIADGNNCNDDSHIPLTQTGVSGCIMQKSQPIKNSKVLIIQSGEFHKSSDMDIHGCFAIENLNNERAFSIFIRKKSDK